MIRPIRMAAPAPKWKLPLLRAYQGFIGLTIPSDSVRKKIVTLISTLPPPPTVRGISGIFAKESSVEGSETGAYLPVVADSLPQAVLMLDADKKVLYANPASAELFDGEPGEIIGQTLAQLPDAQASQRAAEEIAHLNLMAGGLAHDLASPLTVFRSYLWSLKGQVAKVGEGLPQDKKVTLAAIDKGLTDMDSQAERITTLVTEFRQLTVPPRSQKPVSLEHFLRAAFIQNLLGHDARLVMKADPEPWWVWGDSSNLERVIQNLVVNAREAMEGLAEQTLTIETEKLVQQDWLAWRHELGPSASEVTAGDFMRIRISDTGRGMTEDVRQNIFLPYFTTKSPERRSGGFGLALVHRWIRDAGGFIRVISEPNDGSTFEIYLRRAADT